MSFTAKGKKKKKKTMREAILLRSCAAEWHGAPLTSVEFTAISVLRNSRRDEKLMRVRRDNSLGHFFRSAGSIIVQFYRAKSFAKCDDELLRSRQPRPTPPRGPS